MKKLLLAMMLLAFAPVVMQAQTPSMMSMAQAELPKRGLEESEVRARLLAEGIDVDNIPPTEYAHYQQRVISILNKMQAEKASAQGAAAAVAEVAPAVAATGVTDVVNTVEELPQTTTGEAAAEEAMEQALE